MIFRTLLAAALILFSLPALAQEDADDGRIGAFAEVEGTVSAIHGGQTKVAAVGQPVYLNDIVETGGDSKALILFVDDTEFSLGDNAQLTVDEYVFDPDGADKNKGRFSVLRGAFLMTSGLMTKAENHDVNVETAYGSIGLRGTTVWGGAIDDEYNVFVQDGEVTFSTGRGRIRIGSGQGSKVRHKNAVPERAKVWGQEKINRATKTVALKRHDEARQRVTRMKEQHKTVRERHKAIPHDKAKPDQNGKPEKSGELRKAPDQTRDAKNKSDSPDQRPERRKSDTPVHRPPNISPPAGLR